TGGHVEGVHGSIVKEINLLHPDFVLSVGDYIEGYVDDEERINGEWDEYFEIVDSLEADYYMTPGNHDIWSDMSEDIYRKRVGEPYYSFDRDGIHFVMLDLSLWNFGEEYLEEQLEWLESDLEANEDARYIMAFYHKPDWIESLTNGNSNAFHELFKKYDIDAVFTGHYHEYFVEEYDGVVYTGVGSSGAATHEAASDLGYHYMWVTVDDDNIHITPIKSASVYPWDETLAIDKLTFDPIKHLGLTFSEPVIVGDDFDVSNAKAVVALHNDLTRFDIFDSVIWDIPANWKVEPSVLPIEMKAGELKTVEFELENTGKLYPLPTASFEFTYKEGKTVPAKKDLWVAREAVCKPADSKPNIDGRITESFWGEPETVFFDPEGESMQADPTSFYFAYDNDNFYIAAKCTEMNMDSMVATASEHDGPVYSEDCIGFFFQPDPAVDTVYQIYIGASGAAYDCKIWRGEDGWMNYNTNWDGDYEVVVAKSADFWSIEARIPAAQLGAELSTNKDWHLNFRRKQKRLDTSADWMLPIGADPQTLGVLTFE
ncbi:MAG: hypothetical protein GF310_07410, partial [candidate division Zixibacteria bacterium]|nr:hypothetical protein [candidate division Zixibacteria bacterium]